MPCMLPTAHDLADDIDRQTLHTQVLTQHPSSISTAHCPRIRAISGFQADRHFTTRVAPVAAIALVLQYVTADAPVGLTRAHHYPYAARYVTRKLVITIQFEC